MLYRVIVSAGGTACVMAPAIGGRVDGGQVTACPHFRNRSGPPEDHPRLVRPQFRGCSSVFSICVTFRFCGVKNTLRNWWPQAATSTNPDISPLRFRFSIRICFCQDPPSQDPSTGGAKHSKGSRRNGYRLCQIFFAPLFFRSLYCKVMSTWHGSVWLHMDKLHSEN